MTRTLAAATTTEAAKVTGSFPRYILSIAWPGGTLYYSDETLSSPVVAAGVVTSWGSLQLEAQPGRVGATNSMTLMMSDADLSLKAKMETTPGPQAAQAVLYLWYEGTTWATDRVTLFAGSLAAPLSWSEASALWTVTIKGLEETFDTEVGQALTRQAFPEIVCGNCPGDIFPIVYGNDCKRVPVCLIDRPGASTTQIITQQFDTYLYVNNDYDVAGFPWNTPIWVTVGPARMRIIFENGGNKRAARIIYRSDIEVWGTVSGLYGSGGLLYVLVPARDFPDHDQNDYSTPASRNGRTVYFNQGGVWNAFTVSAWNLTGGNVALIPQGSTGIDRGTPYRISAQPSNTGLIGPGTPVQEEGSWTYVCNWLPSAGIERIEVYRNVTGSNGVQGRQWLSYTNNYFAFDTNNTDFNSALGREPSDPGVTTVTLHASPQVLGIEGDVYVTMQGIEDNNDGTGAPITNPVAVIEHLLTHKFLGNVASSNLNAASFTAAKAAVAADFAFALFESKSLNDLVGDLAYQAMCVVFWDAGELYIKAIDNSPSVGVFTINESTQLLDSLTISETDVKDYISELAGMFSATVAADPTTIVRTADAVETAYGRKREELPLWAYQDVADVAAVVEFWLTYKLQRNRTVNVTVFLDALAVQPMDIVTLDRVDGNANDIFDSKLSRVVGITHTPGSALARQVDKIALKCEVQLFSFAVEATSEAEGIDCNVGINHPDELGDVDSSNITSGDAWSSAPSGTEPQSDSESYSDSAPSSSSGDTSSSSSGYPWEACCPGDPGYSIPETLYLTLTDDGGCACGDGVVFTLTWDAVDLRWEGTQTVCGDSYTVWFFCNESNEWRLQIDDSSWSENITGNFCDPLEEAFSPVFGACVALGVVSE